MSEFIYPLYLLITIIFSIIFAISYKKVKSDQFYSDVNPLLLVSGIFVWGDGLVLAPFWILSVCLWTILSYTPIQVGRFLLIFWIARSAYEVIYWIIKQEHQSAYIPPLFRAVKWLKPREHQILYQLILVVLLIICSSILFWTYGL